jgi:hypothetical protein
MNFQWKLWTRHAHFPKNKKITAFKARSDKTNNIFRGFFLKAVYNLAIFFDNVKNFLDIFSKCMFLRLTNPSQEDYHWILLLSSDFPKLI